jgi:hypothetical protein
MSKEEKKNPVIRIKDKEKVNRVYLVENLHELRLRYPYPGLRDEIHQHTHLTIMSSIKES